MQDIYSIELIFAESLSTSYQSYVLSYCLPVIYTYTYIGTASKIKHFELKKNVEMRLKVEVGISPKPIK